MVGQGIDAGRKRARRAVAVAQVPGLARVAHDQVEAVVCLIRFMRAGQVRLRRVVAAQVVLDQRAARRGGGQIPARFAEVGDQRKASLRRHAHPGAAGQTVAPRVQAGRIGPLGGRMRRARVEFVAVGGDQDGNARQGVQGQYGKTHGSDLVGWRGKGMGGAALGQGGEGRGGKFRTGQHSAQVLDFGGHVGQRW
ncbi:hypothetical protein D3C71_1551410 [compost metagenome]